MKSYRFKPEDLNEFMIKFFEKLGVPSERAKIAAEVLLAADLRGVNSHGIIRLHTYYGNRLLKGQIDPRAEIKVLREKPASLTIDGGNGLGQYVAYEAMKRCMEKAEQTGLAMAAVCNSNHYGIAGYYAMMALPNDMIGISYTNSQALVAPTYGKKAMLGTNPIAVAVPTAEEKPYVLDMATSIVPLGRVDVYRKAGETMPEGWAMDADGNTTTDPHQVIPNGALYPLGGPDITRGYKGYGLSMMVDIFSGVLSGAAFGTHVGRPQTTQEAANVGHYFAAMKINAFRDLDEFKNDMDQMIRELKSSPKAKGQERIFIHGEKEFELEAKNRENGIPILESVVTLLQEAGEQAGVPFDLKPLQ
jgi:LDH2 family malate/lactate/ureidoglycolate dehydrogenase